MQPDVFVSTFRHERDVVPVQYECTWDGLCQTLTKHLANPDKKAGALFNFCRFSSPRRANENVVDVSALLLDVDDQPLDFVQALGAKLAPYAYVSYSTWRHGSVPDLFRLRFAVRLSRPVLGTEWKAFARAVQAWLGSGLDGCVIAASQAYYLPSHHPDRAPLTHVQPGESLSVESLLASVPAIAPEDSSPVPDTWRPEQSFTLEHLNKLTGAVAARLASGGKLALPGETNHANRRALVYQFLCEYGPGEPDAQLLQLLVNSAQASRETWLGFFTSGSARAKAEAQHAANLVRDAKAQAEVAGWERIALQNIALEAAQVRQASQDVSKQARGTFSKEVLREVAKRAKPEVKAVLLAACAGQGVPAELVAAIPEAGAWLGRREAGRDPGVLKSAFVHMPDDQKPHLFAGIDLGHAQARHAEPWRKALSMADEKIVPCEKNVRVLLTQHEKTLGKLMYDVRADRVRVSDVPWVRPSDPFWCNADAGGAMVWISDLIGSPVSSRQVDEALNGCKESLPTCDLVQLYLQGLPEWDGVPRLSQWLHTYAGAPLDTYTCEVARRCLIAAVARAMRPGCKVDQVVVLEGDQGVKKTTLIRALCPDPSLFLTAEGALSLDNVRLVHKIQGCWIAEIGELSGLRRSDQDAAKAFLSEQVDSYRAPYGRHVLVRPRRFVFFGTANRTDYLSDTTGNRRWLPIPGPLVCKPEALARDRDQLWAEAYAAFNGGESWWVESTPEVRAVQASRLAEDALTPDVLDCAEHFGEVCYAQVFEYLGIAPERRQAHRLGAILTLAGWVQGPKKRKEIVMPAGPGLLIAGRNKKTNDRFWTKGG